MQLHMLASAAIVSSVLASSTVLGAAIAKPFWGADAASTRVTSTLGAAATPSSDARGAALVAQLLTAGTAAQRYKLLAPADFSYDFNHPPEGAMVQGAGM